MGKSGYLEYIHNFRGLAILYIVLIHLAITNPWTGHEVGEKIALVLFANGTILFVFISGFLFYYLGHERFDYVNYLKKRFSFVILPYLIISIPAILDKLLVDGVGDHWWLTQEFDQQPILVKIFSLLVTGRHNGVLWFIPMMTIIYLIADPLIRFSRSKAFDYLAPVAVIAGLFLHSYGYRSNISFSFLYFFPVFIFGMWVCRKREFLHRSARLIMWVAGCSYFVLSALEINEIVPFTDLLRWRDLNEMTLALNLNKVKLHVLAIFLVTFFHIFLNRKISFLSLLGNYSFGIFFIHLYVIGLIQYLNRLLPIWGDSFGLISFFLVGSLVVAISVLIVFGVKFFFKEKSRYLIGS